VSDLITRHGKKGLAIVLTLSAYAITRAPAAGPDERVALASRFHFEKTALFEPNGIPMRTVRSVNPKFKRIERWISAVGAAAALGDLDGDGLSNDVCYIDTRTDSVIVSPVPGTGPRYDPFLLHTVSPGYDERTIAPMGCLIADLNEDGLLDIVVYFWGRTPVAFLRRTGFEKPQPGAYVQFDLAPAGDRWYTNAATTGDFDGDGHFDILFGNYFPDGARVLDEHASDDEQMQESMAKALNGGRKHLLLWQRASKGPQPTVAFQEAVDAIPPAASQGWTLGLASADLDGDLLPEIYIANDFGPDRLLHNRSTPGHPHFTIVEGKRKFAVPKSETLGRDSFKGMSAGFTDLMGHGLPDILVSNIAAEFALEENHFAFINTGETGLLSQGTVPFEDRAEELGLARSNWAWDFRAADLDNDGRQEVLQAIGFVKGTVNRWPELHELAMGNDLLLSHPGSWLRVQTGDDLSGASGNAFYVRGDRGIYANVAEEVGFSDPQTTRGIALADVDGDGLLDFVCANQWQASNFYRNRSTAAGAFIGLHLLRANGGNGVAAGVRSGHPARDITASPAIGAVVTVKLPDGGSRWAQVDGGSGHSGKSSNDVHFGLGAIPPGTKLAVSVKWRDRNGSPRMSAERLEPGWHTWILK
jgi:enediyne biosynthesis protein E4